MFKKSQFIAQEKVGDILVIFEEKNEEFYYLDKLEQLIWDNIETRTVDEMVSFIYEQYDEKKDKIKNDLLRFYSELLEKELIYEK